MIYTAADVHKLLKQQPEEPILAKTKVSFNVDCKTAYDMVHPYRITLNSGQRLSFSRPEFRQLWADIALVLKDDIE